MTSSPFPSAGRGRPFWALGGVLLGWILLRAMLLELPIAPASPLRAAGPSRGSVRKLSSAAAVSERGHALTRVDLRDLPKRPSSGSAAPWPASRLASATGLQLGQTAAIGPEASRQVDSPDMVPMAARGGSFHVGEARTSFDQTISGSSTGLPVGEAPRHGGRRWSGDVWVVWRTGTAGPVTAGTISPFYGASQAGAVIRYDLGPGSPMRPAAYVRAAHALAGARDSDLAAGLAVRPFARVPVVVHGEVRASRRGTSLEARPAAFVSGGVDDAPIGGGFIVRGYAQGGYVGGREASLLADGSVVAERQLVTRRDGVVGAGAGLWGGAQKGAARLDIGPTASLRIPMGGGSARLSADYRLRIAGNARPATGAALTLSAGF